MADILATIIATKRLEVEAHKRAVPFPEIRAAAESAPPPRNFGEALLAKKSGAGIALARIIAECKRQSPSRGVMIDPYDPVRLASAYEEGGAAAISVLTDEPYFGGKLDHLEKVSGSVKIPVLRKDFIVDEYQVYEARAFGADSFLLLAGVLDSVQLQYFTEIGRDLGMEPLVESHDMRELDLALRTDCVILGINNRNLKSFDVSFDAAGDLARHAQSSSTPRILIGESGIKSREDIDTMHAAGYGGFLIGETLVRATDPAQTLRGLVGS